MDQSPAPAVNAQSDASRAVVAGHFGELVQGIAGGEVVLVTLPCPALVTQVSYRPGTGPLEVAGAETAKTRVAGEALLARIAPGMGGRLEIERPAAPGTGVGSSTADILAALRAIAGAFGVSLSAEEEVGLALAAEGAVDPLMYPGTVLFASRRGVVLERLPAPPPMRVVGALCGPGRATDPADRSFAPADMALTLLRDGLASGDLAAVAEAASLSAAANDALRPHPAATIFAEAARDVGALGEVTAHTGSARGLILRPNADPGPALEALAKRGITGAFAFDPYRTATDRPEL